MTGLRTMLIRTAIIWLLLEVISAAQVRSNEETLLWSWVRVLGQPFRASAGWLHGVSGDLFWGLQDARRLVSEVQQLEEELEIARARAALLEEDVNSLREAHQIPLVIKELSGASVISRCRYRNIAQSRLEIGAGLSDGIRYDTPVLCADGLVGRVVRVAARSCWVETITHPAAAVAVCDRDGTVSGIAVGAGHGLLQVQYVPRRTQLLRGTELFSSGADGVYPPGIRVARVSSIRETEDAFLDVYAAAAADLELLKLVVLLPAWSDDQSVGTER
jgi:rod shape-determining protein MreC